MRLTADVIVVSGKAMCCIGVLHLGGRYFWGQVVVAERERATAAVGQTGHIAIEGWGAFAGWIHRVCRMLTERFPHSSLITTQGFSARWRRRCLAFCNRENPPSKKTQHGRKSKISRGGVGKGGGGGVGGTGRFGDPGFRGSTALPTAVTLHKSFRGC